MFCKKCGKELPEKASYCPFCGEAVEIAPNRLFSFIELKLRKWIIISVIWAIIIQSISFIVYSDRYYFRERRLLFLLAFCVPLLAWLIVFLIKMIQKEQPSSTKLIEEMPFVQFASGYDNIRFEKVSNKYTGAIDNYCTFSKSIRIKLDESAKDIESAEDVANHKKELFVKQRGANDYVIIRKQNS